MRSLILATAMAVASPLPASALVPGQLPPHTARTSSVGAIASEPEHALVTAGEQAPDFSFEGPDGHWRRLKDLRAQGHVLLVFGATEGDLTALDREREALQRMGIVPVAVLARRSGACWAIARRLGLGCIVAPDPQRVIAAQFNVLDRRTRDSHAAWFVVDARGRVRALDRRGWPARWTESAAEALNLPAPDATLQGSTR